MAKSKQRTRKSAAKRFKITATGKLLHRSNTLRHLKAHKSKKQQRSLKTMKVVTGIVEKKIKKMLGTM